MQPTVIIGDVHGCLHELEALWDQLAPTLNTRVIFLGDLIDRGPDSPGVVDFIQKISRDYELILITGNHEMKVIKQARKGLVHTVGLSEEHIRFLEKGQPFYRFESGQFLAVHGGVHPAFCTQFDALPDQSTPEQWSPTEREQVERFMYCRYVNQEGKTVALGRQTDDDHFWADVYQGKFGTVFFGHQPFLKGPVLFPYAVSLDTGCAFGGSLSAAHIDEKSRITFHSVKAQQAYGSYINYGNEIASTQTAELQVPYMTLP